MTFELDGPSWEVTGPFSTVAQAGTEAKLIGAATDRWMPNYN